MTSDDIQRLLNLATQLLRRVRLVLAEDVRPELDVARLEHVLISTVQRRGAGWNDESWLR